MDTSRTKRTLINIFAAVSLKVLQIILPFIGRTIIIHRLGTEYVGLSGLFNSIIGVLSLAELGVGSALVYAMYQPVQEKNKEKICQILSFYKRAYFTIGVLILIMGLMVTPFLTTLIKDGTYPETINLYFIYFAYLSSTVATYLIYAYKASLLDAHQMGVVGSKVKFKMLVTQYIVQIIMLMCIGNYYSYIIVLPICTIITCFMLGKVADKYFPGYIPKGKLKFEEKKAIVENVKALFLYKIGSAVLNSVDNIIISWYFGAFVLGIYNNYYYIIASLFSLLLAVGNAILPSIGNSIVSETKEKNYNDFIMFSFGYNWIIGWCTICLVCLMQTFMDLWIGKNNLLSFGCVVLFGVYFFSFRVGDVVGWYRDAAGLWRADRYRPIVSSILNLCLNIILIRFIGLYGVLISTILALIIVSYPIAARILLKYFEQEGKIYFIQQFIQIICIFISGCITYKICTLFNYEHSFFTLIARLAVCIFIPNFMLLALFSQDIRLKKLKIFCKRNILNIKKD